jgi:hypothetical protein
MKNHLLFFTLLMPLMAAVQRDNLQIIDDAEKQYLRSDTWRYKHRHMFKELGALLNGRDTIYLDEVITGNPDNYTAHIYMGNGDMLRLQVSCTPGRHEKCGKPKLTRFKVADQHASLQFPPCYFEWFRTFDTVYLHQMTERQESYSAIPCTVLVRIIKGQASIYYTELHYAQIHDLRQNDIICPDLNTKQ